MAKKVKIVLKLQIPGGQATPAPPVGSTLGQHGLNIGEFVSKFNEQTKDQQGVELPVEIKVYEDRTYDFKVKTPAASFLLKKAAGIDKGSGQALKEKVGKVTKKQVLEIAEKKMPDLNADTVEQAAKIIEGTARSMGITVE